MAQHYHGFFAFMASCFRLEGLELIILIFLYYFIISFSARKQLKNNVFNCLLSILVLVIMGVVVWYVAPRDFAGWYDYALKHIKTIFYVSY